MRLNSLATSRVTYDQPQSKGTAVFAASDDAAGPKGQDVQNALSALVEYIPAETVTLYLATVSSLPVLVDAITGMSAAVIYALFGVLTPVLFALI